MNSNIEQTKKNIQRLSEKTTVSGGTETLIRKIQYLQQQRTNKRKLKEHLVILWMRVKKNFKDFYLKQKSIRLMELMTMRINLDSDTCRIRFDGLKVV